MSNLPEHIAIIMDGNGRWAKQRNLPRYYGHKKGYDALENLIEYAVDRGVKCMSFYAFSTENWARPKDEVSRLLALMARGIKVTEPKLVKNQVKLVVSGDCSIIKPKVKANLDALIKKTSVFTRSTVNICFNYGSRDELVRAFNKMREDNVSEISEKTVSDYLYTAALPEIDLLIRTSGEQRLSNFMLWQSAYAELYFTDTLWPDFDGKELEKALDWFAHRSRRFGKV